MLGVEVLKKLKREKGYIRVTKGNSLTIKAGIQDLEGITRTTARTLIDSGSMGSCIDSGFIKRHGFTTHKVPVSVTVYNANGSINECGRITEYVEATLSMGEHSEQIHLGVVKLGNADIFLGHDWLLHHNPSIDWTNRTLHFDRCPG